MPNWRRKDLTNSIEKKRYDTASALIDQRLCEYERILECFHETEKEPAHRTREASGPSEMKQPYPETISEHVLNGRTTRATLESEVKIFKRWGEETKSMPLEGSTSKHDSRNLSPFQLNMITRILGVMEDVLSGTSNVVKQCQQSSRNGPRELTSSESELTTELSHNADNLRTVVVMLEVSVIPREQRRRDDSIKGLLRSCMMDYDTVVRQLNDANMQTKPNKVLSRDIARERNSLARWARETGVLREGDESLESKLTHQDKEGSRENVDRYLRSVISTLKDTPDLIERCPGGYVTELQQRVDTLAECNKSLNYTTRCIFSSAGSIGCEAEADKDTSAAG